MTSRLSDRPLGACRWLLLIGAALGPRPALAGDSPSEASATAQAREEFVRGTELARRAQWSEAFASFERSAKLRPHAVTTYNIGACERALGRYTVARETLTHALAENDASQGRQLPEATVADIRGYLDQIDHLLATATIDLDPAPAALAVDGRPLESALLQGDAPTLIAGVRAPGPGEEIPSAHFRLVLDPGAHVITVSRKGYANALVNRTFLPGSITHLALNLDRLPATLHVDADQPRALVTVDDADTGLTPVDVSRPAGSYHIAVTKPGFVRYEAQVVLHPGGDVTLSAALPRKKTSLLQEWWFWTAASAVLAAVATGTYFIARGESAGERPPLNGGGLGWTVQAN